MYQSNNSHRLNWIAVACLAISCTFAASVNASSVSYGVANTGKVDCYTKNGDAAEHGLWTNKFKAGGKKSGCEQFYSFDKQSTLEVGKKTATLSAKATNPYGVVADIDFKFWNPKTEEQWENSGGVIKTYSDQADSSDWTFYKRGSGTINVSYEEQVGKHLLQVQHSFKLDLVDDTAFQFGVGANDKTSKLGASGWLDINRWLYTLVVREWDSGAKVWRSSQKVWPKLYDWKLGKHWDLNMELSAVPIPGAVWLFITGLLGLAGYNSRKRHQQPVVV